MRQNTPDPGAIIDRAVREIRNDVIPQDHLTEVGDRVKTRLRAARGKVLTHPALHGSDGIDGCDGYQSLIPAFLTASITSSRKVLFEDHVAECVVCRKALESARHGARTKAQNNTLRRGTPSIPLAVLATAALLLTAVFLSQADFVRDVIWPIDVHAMVRTVEGNLYGISGQEIRAVNAGQRIDRSQLVRSGVGSRALLELADGSQIEMAERSELVLDRARDGVRIRLERGNVIVTASRQRNGHLYVATADCTVAVVGTVFSVSAGAKGSRVSVIEGKVEVEHGQSSQVVLPGQQVTTSSSVNTVDIWEDIRWSRQLNQHLAALKQHVALSQSLARTIGDTAMRRTSNLVPLVPADTMLLGSMPNTAQSIHESYELLKKRISEHSMLDLWWKQTLPLDLAVDLAERLSQYLGPEIVIAAPRTGGASGAVLLADVTRPDELIAALGRENLSPDVIIRVSGTLLVMASNTAQVGEILRYQTQSSANAFRSSPLYRRLEQAYSEGVGWLLAADLEKLSVDSPAELAELENLGLTESRQLVIEQKTGSGGASYQATLGFKGERRGIASWLGKPSNMGALEFVSPNAYSVAGVITKDPGQILDDVFAILQRNSREWQKVQEYQEKNHIELRYDVALQLGNEFLFALDGPLLPSPSWKIVIEVNDAARLQNTLQVSINEANRQAAVNQKPGITLTTESSGGLTFYKLATSDLRTELHYTFWAGYLIVTPNRVLLSEAIQFRNTGNSLVRSAEFRSQLPADGRDEISGLVYYNLKSITDMTIPLPGLVCLYGQEDRILMSSKGVLGMNIASADFLSNMMDVVRR